MLPSEANRMILDALRRRHQEDVTSAEVSPPNEAGTGISSQRVDFWAMACSWAKPRVIAYEVKVDRRDFVQDAKWPTYLRLCHELVFVTRQGVATLEEIPTECGWQELSKNGKQLVTRKKAPRHPMEPKQEAALYKHLLMRFAKKGVPAEQQWREWLNQQRSERELGRIVSREIRQTLNERVRAVQQENRKLQLENESLAGARRVLEELGLMGGDKRQIVGSAYMLENAIRRKVTAMQAGELAPQIKDMATKLQNASRGLPELLELMKGFDVKVNQELAAAAELLSGAQKCE